MYIQTNDSINMRGAKNSGFWKRLKQKALNALPNSTIKDPKDIEKYKKINTSISHPAKNRLIMGTTAIVTQPTIDFFNRDVSEDTRKVSRNRTIAKIIIGTLVGMAVRGSCYDIVKRTTVLNGNKKFSKAMLPPKYIKNFEEESQQLDNYRNALSTFLAMVAMSFTNFLVDAPLTLLLTNYFNRNLPNGNNEKKAGGE